MLLPVNSHHFRATSADLSLIALRVAVAGILVWGALTKLVSDTRIGELAQVWSAASLPQAELLVMLSIGLQLVLALFLLVGLFAQVAGWLVAANFTAGAAVSGIFSSGTNWWPFVLLIALMLHFAMSGAGKLSVDAVRARLAALGAQPRSLDEVMASIGVEPRPEGRDDPTTSKK